MLLMIFTGSVGFSQLLAYSGATRGLIEFATSLPVSPFVLLIFMMVGVVILGCFIDAVSIIMISVPIYMPIVNYFGFDPVWFGLMMLILIEMGGKTPPFGMSLFLMKGLSPPGTTMGEVIRSVLPIVGIELLTVSLILAFPAIAIWLPGVIRGG
jgi:TRAP-type C4-dicarboxylate transport system permease large subunit